MPTINIYWYSPKPKEGFSIPEEMKEISPSIITQEALQQLFADTNEIMNAPFSEILSDQGQASKLQRASTLIHKYNRLKYFLLGITFGIGLIWALGFLAIQFLVWDKAWMVIIVGCMVWLLVFFFFALISQLLPVVLRPVLSTEVHAYNDAICARLQERIKQENRKFNGNVMLIDSSMERNRPTRRVFVKNRGNMTFRMSRYHLLIYQKIPVITFTWQAIDEGDQSSNKQAVMAGAPPPQPPQWGAAPREAAQIPPPYFPQNQPPMPSNPQYNQHPEQQFSPPYPNYYNTAQEGPQPGEGGQPQYYDPSYQPPNQPYDSYQPPY